MINLFDNTQNQNYRSALFCKSLRLNWYAITIVLIPQLAFVIYVNHGIENWCSTLRHAKILSLV